MPLRTPPNPDAQIEPVSAEQIDKLPGAELFRKFLDGTDPNPSSPSDYLQETFHDLQERSSGNPSIRTEMYTTLEDGSPCVQIVKSVEEHPPGSTNVLHTARLYILDDQVTASFNGSLVRDEQTGEAIAPLLQTTMDIEMTWKVDGTCTLMLRKKKPESPEKSIESIITVQIAPDKKYLESKTIIKTPGNEFRSPTDRETPIRADLLTHWGSDLGYPIQADVSMKAVLKHFFNENTLPLPLRRFFKYPERR